MHGKAENAMEDVQSSIAIQPVQLTSTGHGGRARPGTEELAVDKEVILA